MKTILNKVEFHYTYLIIAIGFVLTGYFSNLIVFTSLILIHELGHIVSMLHYKINIKKITIYAYGGVTKVDNIIDNNIDEELIIAISGVFFQTILYSIIFILYNNNVVSDNIFNLYTLYHYSMLVFNLLPICGLDGFKILNLYLSKFINFRLANIISLIISIILLIIMAILGFNNYSYVMILTLLIYNIYEFYINLDYLYNRFLLERYLYKINNKKIKIINNINKMHRNKYHFIKKDKSIIEERRVLVNMFEKK